MLSTRYHGSDGASESGAPLLGPLVKVPHSYEWVEVLVISHGDKDVALLQLVDEVDPQGIRREGDDVAEARQDM